MIALFTLALLSKIKFKKLVSRILSSFILSYNCCRFKVFDFTGVYVLSPYHEPKTTALMKLLSRKYKYKVLLDVGAHIGKYSILFASGYYDKVSIALEPHPLNASFLFINTKLNNATVVIVPSAAYSKNTILHLYDQSDSSIHTILRSRARDARRVVKVPAITLDTLFKKMKQNGIVKNIDILKIDVEGCEYEVVVGAKRLLQECRPIVIIEISDDKKIRVISEIMLPLNYRYILLENNNYLFIPLGKMKQE